MASPPRVLWIASKNAKKRAELERLLGPLGISLRLMDELEAPLPELPEDEPDFAGNARSKATHLMQALRERNVAEPGCLALGDDSGLCVDALDGAPGVRSARWAGPTDADRNDALLAELAARSEAPRSAHFVCSICVVDSSSDILAAAEERCSGTLLEATRGEGGFGYDPLFVPDQLAPGEAETGRRRTFAELSAEQKDAVSHRGRALRSLAQRLAEV